MSKLMHKVKDAFTGHHGHKSNTGNSETVPEAENASSGAYSQSDTGHYAPQPGDSGAQPSADPYTSGAYDSGENTAAYEARTSGYDSKPSGGHEFQSSYGQEAENRNPAQDEYGSGMTGLGPDSGSRQMESRNTSGVQHVSPGGYNRGSDQVEASDIAGPYSSGTEGRTQQRFGGGGAEGSSSYNTHGTGELSAGANDYSSGGKLDSGRVGANMMGSNMMASDNLRTAGGAQRNYW
ncbi:hypothetical protein ASPACDRAFT_40499 [Aspergillus aculeatus ATCC 16872]|uniref:Uncharacterized protein n=1 Tax=Aspergillus aculeatus (strain ATCC 16872 / CBS 172.66 / WB 5094) TaxID=690307 RepID=A0A1L9X3Y3_ASPA1|nr:uncharacterized protein ASPACDRAFT_40499 [Aspergillus aculeatus ATCC 16872]OJK03175.1 hypothetical protein ASPACDRAFT_40499 [Aspergillus aculeatus ATCC 16872]